MIRKRIKEKAREELGEISFMKDHTIWSISVPSILLRVSQSLFLAFFNFDQNWV